jgi:two-component SAPR family response regulator
MSGSRPESHSNVRRLHPVRVLVAADDPRFLAVATILLSRAEFIVESTARLGDVVALVERGSPHAVILDATDSLAATARCAAAIGRLRPAVKVVVVSDHPAASRTSFATFPKWDSFPDIVAEIERVAGSGGVNHRPPSAL